MSDIDTYQSEERRYPPPAEFAARANAQPDIYERSFEEFWETTLDLSRAFHDAVLERPQGEIEQIKAAVRARIAAFETPDGMLDIPARTLVASASA